MPLRIPTLVAGWNRVAARHGGVTQDTRDDGDALARVSRTHASPVRLPASPELPPASLAALPALLASLFVLFLGGASTFASQQILEPFCRICYKPSRQTPDCTSTTLWKHLAVSRCFSDVGRCSDTPMKQAMLVMPQMLAMLPDW